jgi:hypothetical protein
MRHGGICHPCEKSSSKGVLNSKMEYKTLEMSDYFSSSEGQNKHNGGFLRPVTFSWQTYGPISKNLKRQKLIMVEAKKLQ